MVSLSLSRVQEKCFTNCTEMYLAPEITVRVNFYANQSLLKLFGSHLYLKTSKKLFITVYFEHNGKIEINFQAKTHSVLCIELKNGSKTIFTYFLYCYCYLYDCRMFGNLSTEVPRQCDQHNFYSIHSSNGRQRMLYSQN